ncbi:hypothetical protein TRAPUB_14286 [Trametes pubescens]|uniref:Uncharacterized protein n=1 Tax=Trametes pubescens TaxID=154538 RepID=A0A1M2VNV7_TRAPU|nr:hypothetical protein TRAPUB_14286 [Trametes pubescens]
MPARVTTTRNVQLADHEGVVLAGAFLSQSGDGANGFLTCATGFYQHGSVSWNTFFSWLDLLFDTTDPWIIVGGGRFTSEQYFPTEAVVLSGKYVLLAPGRISLAYWPLSHELDRHPCLLDHSPLRIKLVSTQARRRQGVSSRVRKGEINLQHARDRDRKRMSTGTEMSWSRLQAAHVFSSSHLHQVRIQFRTGWLRAPTRPLSCVRLSNSV